LLLLLVKTLAPLDRSQALHLLNKFGIYVAERDLPRKMRWARRRLAAPSFVRLAAAYLDVSRELLFSADHELNPAEGDVAAESFDEREWIERILHLQAWRLAWEEGDDRFCPKPGSQNTHGTRPPTEYAHRIEFHLARRGSFRRLSRQGGVVARHVLHTLGYRDRPRTHRRPIREILMLILLLAGTAATIFGIVEKATRWDRSNVQMAHQIKQTWLRVGQGDQR
jgi:hypothetical protein